MKQQKAKKNPMRYFILELANGDSLELNQFQSVLTSDGNLVPTTEIGPRHKLLSATDGREISIETIRKSQSAQLRRVKHPRNDQPIVEASGVLIANSSW